MDHESRSVIGSSAAVARDQAPETGREDRATYIRDWKRRHGKRGSVKPPLPDVPLPGEGVPMGTLPAVRARERARNGRGLH